jgi:hypothetical protein
LAPGAKQAVLALDDPTLGTVVGDHRENAEAYKGATYPQVLKALDQVIEGTPQVKTYEVSNSTWHEIAAQPRA